MAVRITKKDRYLESINIMKELGREDLVEFFTHEYELCTKKSENKTLTKTQVENEGLREVILGVLRNTNEALTIGEIQTYNDSLVGLTSSKMSALLKPLVDNKLVIKEYVKKKAYFKIAK